MSGLTKGKLTHIMKKISFLIFVKTGGFWYKIKKHTCSICTNFSKYKIKIVFDLFLSSALEYESNKYT